VLKSRTLSVQILRPRAPIYAYLANPANLANWTMVKGGTRVPEAGPLVWSFDGPRGKVLVHFTPLNEHFILDYRVVAGEQVTQVAYVRLLENGEGTELVHTSVQQPGITDAQFDSEEEWMRSDLLVLKSLLDASGR